MSSRSLNEKLPSDQSFGPEESLDDAVALAAAITEVKAGVGGKPPIVSTIIQTFIFDEDGKIKTLRVYADTPD